MIITRAQDTLFCLGLACVASCDAMAENTRRLLMIHHASVACCEFMSSIQLWMNVLVGLERAPGGADEGVGVRGRMVRDAHTHTPGVKN